MISEHDYGFLAEMLLKRSGLSLGDSKEYLLEARLIPLAQSMGLSDLAGLVKELRKPDHDRIASAVTEAMTTNETLFLRDKVPFEEFKDSMLPELIEARRSIRSLRIWSAASSTGQEAYSIAMTIRDHFPALADWRIEIVGTDLSSQALARAEAGIYSQFEVQRGLPITSLMKHFVQSPQGWRITPQIRGQVRFEKLNLLDNFCHLGSFDVIFCRNVLIYFEVAAKKHVLDRMVKQLRSDGFLILGAAETVMGVTDVLDRRRTFRSAVYGPRSALSRVT